MVRPSNIIGLVASLFALATAYFFLERQLGLEPCPLCILDRIIVAAMGLCFAAGLLVESLPLRRGLLAANAVFLASGLGVAGRHVWLENRPFDESLGCLGDSPAAAGLIDLVRKAFDAQADCSFILWELFGFSIPDYTLGMFVLVFAPLLAAQAYGIRTDSRQRSGRPFRRHSGSSRPFAGTRY